MARLAEVDIPPLDPDRFESVIDPERFVEFVQAIVRALEILDARVVWNVNSTARGGGVAEMLLSLLAYSRGAGVDARWLVIEGNPDFFRVTKRIHNNLHGAPGDGGALGDDERRVYDSVAEDNARALSDLVSPGDVVILHDPQTAGLAPAMRDKGAQVIWRCHVGLDLPQDLARQAWSFLIDYVRAAHAYVFSRGAFAWEGLEPEKISIIPPSIDAFSPKNQEIDPSVVTAILAATGLSDRDARVEPTYIRVDATQGLVSSRTEVTEEEPLPSTAPVVAQVSRWDRLKDPSGVMRGFVEHVAPEVDAHLVLAGPSVEAVADDPEGAEVLAEAKDAWSRMPPDRRARIHLACLPMNDLEENAAIVNALQRRANIVVQKSIAEGFGLTVAEAMWKARPVVASRIGGIQDQIVDGSTGILVDPLDLAGYGNAVRALIADPEAAEHMGAEAQRRVRKDFLGPRHLMQYVDLIGTLLDVPGKGDAERM